MQLRNEAEEKLREQIHSIESELTASRQVAVSLRSELDRVSPWTQVANANDEAQKVIQQAQEKSKGLIEAAELRVAGAAIEATQMLDKATAESRSIVEIARQSANDLKKAADEKLRAALSESAKIIAEAHDREKEIAGEAYTAMQNARQYEQTISAIKNMIEGYGNRFIVPNRSLLDDLADNFSHADAGEELKRARERARAMVLSGAAALCDYVEENRKVTAINFVTDAFNGKVDSILSRARHDNFGKLQQEIRDSFAVVNFLGKAFRNARVTEEYLAVRLNELKWAVVVNELRIAEQDEQRRIREQLREEEKARREIERALKEAAKEEEILKRAMEKAQRQIDQSSAEQKKKYELELAVLSEKLRAAEEKNQRALSMAQQTKRGHVYIISNVGSLGEDVFKIGLTRRLDPLDRVRELGDSSVPFEFDVHAMVFSDDAPSLEHKLHQHFALAQVNKVNYRKEFFRVPLGHIRTEMERLGIECKWTMVAAAREYYETIAIEKMIEENPDHRDSWLRRQLQVQELDPAYLTATAKTNDLE